METPHTSPGLALETLRRTQPWLRFLGIMLMIGTGLTLLVGIGLCGLGLVATGLHTEEGERTNGPMLIVMGLIYIPLAFVYLYPAILLLRSAARIRAADASNAETAVVESLEAQRKFWKYAGICVIVMMALYALAILLAIALPALKALSSL